MANKDKINAVRQNSERMIEGNITRQKEFKYDLTGGFVSPNQPYTIYFTNDKREIYLTGYRNTTNAKFINKIGKKSIINTYREINYVEKSPYPQNNIAVPTEEDYKIKRIRRFFAKVANDNTKEFFEINQDDYDINNSLFEYIEINWMISGKKEDVERVNRTTLDRLPTRLQKILFPLQLWRPSPDSSDSLEKKLERLRK